ncbi:MAG: NAD-dependent epimerase/dehydratase family protein [Acidobacteria bacterium]|nr:NAD-dependent epimerase/dehydratase family protein [Acidobacteriota bacterium]
MKTLILGGAGYVGSTLTRRLWEAGHDVTVYDRLLFGSASLEPLQGRERFRLIEGDIRDAAALQAVTAGQDAVALLAAIVGEPACNRDPQLAVETNLLGARNALAAARRAGVDRFVFGSTCSNYGVSRPDALVDETAPLQPLSTYSETKVQAEKEILAAASELFHPTVLRFSTAFGISARMRFDLLVSDFTRAAVREGKVVVYGEQFWRPFVHIEDIAKAVELVLGASSETVGGEVFNIGANSANTQKIELARRVQHRVEGSQLEFVKRDVDPRSYRVDFTKVRQRLGFVSDWSVDDGIREVHEALLAGVWADPYSSRYQN